MLLEDKTLDLERKITNFLLTGKIHIGKTTTLNKLVSNPLFNGLNVRGLKTTAIVENESIEGYAIQLINDMKKAFAHVNLASHETFDRYNVNIQAFDELSKRALKSGILKSDLILMDEIGMMEQKSAEFINFIVQCLNSEKLFVGIFQQRAQWFRKLIQNRNDVLIFEVTENNRDSIHNRILLQIQKYYYNVKINLTNLK